MQNIDKLMVYVAKNAYLVLGKTLAGTACVKGPHTVQLSAEGDTPKRKRFIA